MKSQPASSIRRFLAACIILGSASVLQWFLIGGSNPFQQIESFVSMPKSPTMQAIVVKHNAAITSTAQASPTPSITKLVDRHARFQLGMVFPRWGSNAYGSGDLYWQNGLIDIYHQTRSQWIEMVVNLYQDSLTSTNVQVREKMAPTPVALAEGIRTAHAMGYRVFISILLSVGGPNPWAGSIQFSSPTDERAWFTSYWKAVAPFVRAANQERAEQFAIGTEYEKLQQASPALWQRLIGQFHHAFQGRLSYNINWSSMSLPIPTWMHSRDLATIGVSVYIPLVDQAVRLNPAALPALWRQKVRSVLDAYATQVKKPVLISEIGYRNSADALYNPWIRETQARSDPEEQAAAYNAALQNVVDDPHIAGIFFWAWSFPVFQPNDLPASNVIRQWYSSRRVK